MSTYFDGEGKKYTEAAVKEAVARATSRGVDTAIVTTPGHAAKALDQIKIHEIICKPGLY